MLQAENCKSTMSVIKYYCNWFGFPANAALRHIIVVIVLVAILLELTFFGRQRRFVCFEMKTKGC